MILPFVLDEEANITIVNDKKRNYALERRRRAPVPITPNMARYGIALKIEGYLSNNELWQAFHTEEAQPTAVRYQIRDLRESIAFLTNKELITTRHGMRPLLSAENEISDLIGGGYYMGELSKLRNEPENILFWNGFYLNVITGYFELPDGRGFDSLEYEGVKYLSKLMLKKGNVVHKEEHNVSPSTVMRLRRRLGEEYLGMRYGEGYYLINPTQSHQQRAYASQYLKVPGRSA